MCLTMHINIIIPVLSLQYTITEVLIKPATEMYGLILKWSIKPSQGAHLAIGASHVNNKHYRCAYIGFTRSVMGRCLVQYVGIQLDWQ